MSKRPSLWFWTTNLGASCCNLPVEVAEGVEPFCERRSTLLWICQLFPESDCQTSLESCSLSWGHATSVYVNISSNQTDIFSQIFRIQNFPVWSHTKMAFSNSRVNNITSFIPAKPWQGTIGNDMVWIKTFTSLAFGQEQHILDCHSPSLHIQGPLHPSSKPGYCCTFAFGELKRAYSQRIVCWGSGYSRPTLTPFWLGFFDPLGGPHFFPHGDLS